MYCLDSGILQEKTIPETPQQNGLAERCNRTLLEIARCLLIYSDLPKMMWGAAILHATRIRNLERVFTDVMGPFESRVRVRFCIVFADQYTKFVFVDLPKAKSEALASLKKFVFSVGTPKKLRQDNAKEFLSEQFKMFCLDAGILQEKTIPETAQQNGLVESSNRTLLDMARCLLIDSGLPKMMWEAAILYATRSRKLVVRQGEEKCRAELMRALKPKLSISKL